MTSPTHCVHCDSKCHNYFSEDGQHFRSERVALGVRLSMTDISVAWIDGHCPFCGERDHYEAEQVKSRAKWQAEGALNERVRIVEWMRELGYSQKEYDPGLFGGTWQDVEVDKEWLIDAIERGAHVE